MHSRATSEPVEGGLSTEDLAGARQDTDEQNDTSGADSPPAFPGEATTEQRSGEQEFTLEGRDREQESGQEEHQETGYTQAAEPSERTEGSESAENEPLLGGQQEEFRSRWQKIQGEFVDDPRNAVSAADNLVAEAMQALATTFSAHKQDLEGQWHRGDEVPTEELRVALQRYRSFFNRLLNT
ncbi:hypothetical protein ACFV84_00255 [Kitasatospora sp. NPDC059811]|uniref:hypothetical protein n=1 Tax=Streptomycetaceae TaxID=2062 RepID=UPI0007AF684F|nr:hypothetical protein [Streptomyces sp. MJM8645]